ncbi:MAG: hypothetical protein FWF51_05040 [Chitinivibrionia bacterium]|nr:hypothetical protein [Chitinivibrionia bacterium]
MQFKIKNIKKALTRVAISATIVAATATTVFGDGLPGEYYITQRWRDLLSPYSPASNPALMTEENHVAIRGAFSPSLGNAFQLYEVGTVVPMGLYQSIGFTVLGVTSSEPIRGAIWDADSIKYTGDEFFDNHMMFMGSYAINPFNRLSVGANLNYYKTPNFGDPIQGISLDVGITYRLSNHPVLGEHIIGMNFQNLISPNVFGKPEGGKIEIATQSINAKINWIAHLFDRQVEAGVDFDIKDFTAAKTAFEGAIAVNQVTNEINPIDMAKSIEFDFSGRVGFWLLRMINVYGHFGNQHWGLSGGMNVPSIFGGRDFMAAYQFTSTYDAGAALGAHTVYFRGQFGPHREEIFARKMARQVQLGPGRLYNQMLSEHFAGNYWNSFFIGGRILTEYPDFFRNDYVMYYMGMNTEGMDMRETAMEGYNEVLMDYSRSPVVPLAQLGLLRISYREGDYATVRDLFNQINAPTTPDSVRQAAAYYYGESLLNQDKIMEAIQQFVTIPMTHYDYVFAQHSMGLAYAISGDMNKALEHLDNSVQASVKGNDQRTIIERSYLLMAFLYYEGKVTEGQSLARAMASLRSVSAGSPYRAEALLGQAWVAFKAGNWNDCVSAATALKNATQDPILLSEADLLLAYKGVVDKNFPLAIALLEGAEKRLKEFKQPSASDLKAQEDKYYDDRAKYFETAQKAKEMALVSQSSYVIAQIDSLAPIQRKNETDVRAFGKYSDSYEASQFFGREHGRVLDDVSYALAKARELQGSTASSKSVERVQSLDEEMRKLQEQLRMLE